MSLRLLTVLISTLWSVQSPGAEAISLTIGESRNLQLPSIEVELSRKGVVDLFHSHDQSWVLTGLKRGFVLLTSGGRQWKISVIDHDIQPGTDPQCSYQGVRCEKDKMSVSGTYDSPQVYFGLAQRCQESPACDFAASLSPVGQKNLERLLATVRDWRLTPDHRIEATHFCEATQKPHWPAWLPVINRCWRPQYRAVLRVETNNEQQTQKLGVEHEHYRTGLWQVTSGRGEKLQDQQVETRVRWEATPVFNLVAGHQAVLHAGGEIPIVSPEVEPQWKPFGLQVDLLVRPEHGHISAQYKVGLTSRNGSTLAGSSVASSSQLVEGELTHIASLPLYGESTTESGSHLLHHVPLLGPLFRKWSTQTDAMILQVSMQLMEIEP